MKEDKDKFKWYTWLWLIPVCFIGTIIDVIIEIIYDITKFFRKSYWIK